MELRDYLRVLRKGWALIVAFIILGIALGVGLTLSTTKVYSASAQIFVAASQGSTSADLTQGNTFTQDRVQSYVSIANAPGVTSEVLKNPAIQKLNLHLSQQQLAGKISADAPLNKVLVNIHVSDHSPVVAADLANQVADAFTNYIATSIELPQSPTNSNGVSTGPAQPVVRLTVIHPAIVPSSPTSPNKLLNIGLGLVLGVLVGIGVAVLREVLDNTVKGPQDFEELGVPMLGSVPFDKRTSKTPIAFRGDPHGARSEAYRQIRTNLQFVDVDNPPRIIAVTSAIPGEGKSTSAINLAAALAETGARVCLIEADLRRPSVARVLGLVGDVGFTTVVIGKAPVETVLQNAGRNFAVLTSGPIPPNPSELLLSKHAKQVILDIAAKVDFTIIDTPPLLPVTDGAEIATIADATILVHRASKTTRDQAFRSVEALAKVGKKPVGVILNMITRTGGRYDYEYGYYYGAYRPNTDAKGNSRKSDNGGDPPNGEGYNGEPAGTTITVPAVPAVPQAETRPAAVPESRGRRRKDNGRRSDREVRDQVVPQTLIPSEPRVGPANYALPAQQQQTGGSRPPGSPVGQAPGYGAVPAPPAGQPVGGYSYPPAAEEYPANGSSPEAGPDGPVPPTPLWFRNDGPQQ